MRHVSVNRSAFMSQVRLRISAKWIRLACLPLSFIIALSSLPIHLKPNSAIAQGSVPRRTQGPPSSNLPNIDEARRIKPGPPKAPNPVPSTKCRRRDAACKRARGEAPINQPQGADGNNDELVARVDNDSLSNRFAASERVEGRGFGVPAIDALLNKLSRPAPDTPVGGSLRNNRNVAGVETAPAEIGRAHV